MQMMTGSAGASYLAPGGDLKVAPIERLGSSSCAQASLTVIVLHEHTSFQQEYWKDDRYDDQ
jgi:hypothetical protein